LRDTGLKKNNSLIDENIAISFDGRIAEIYESMARGCGSEIGREILVMRGFVDWLLSFSRKLSLDKSCWNYIPSKSNAQETGEEIVILFANMLR
jgi:hypothetical protein